jgi:hypothetical protein
MRVAEPSTTLPPSLASNVDSWPGPDSSFYFFHTTHACAGFASEIVRNNTGLRVLCPQAVNQLLQLGVWLDPQCRFILGDRLRQTARYLRQGVPQIDVRS